MRYDLLPLSHTENGIEIYDLTAIAWEQFKFDNGYTEHTISGTETYKPHLICDTYNYPFDYLDLILLINEIHNPLDLKVGTILKIPKEIDIANFILEQST